MRMLLLTIAITLVSCTKYVVQPLPCPPPIPESKKLKDSELSCVSKDTYDKIVFLDKRRATLRAICESTQ